MEVTHLRLVAGKTNQIISISYWTLLKVSSNNALLKNVAQEDRAMLPDVDAAILSLHVSHGKEAPTEMNRRRHSDLENLQLATFTKKQTRRTHARAATTEDLPLYIATSASAG